MTDPPPQLTPEQLVDINELISGTALLQLKKVFKRAASEWKDAETEQKTVSILIATALSASQDGISFHPRLIQPKYCIEWLANKDETLRGEICRIALDCYEKENCEALLYHPVFVIPKTPIQSTPKNLEEESTPHHDRRQIETRVGTFLKGIHPFLQSAVDQEITLKKWQPDPQSPHYGFLCILDIPTIGRDKCPSLLLHGLRVGGQHPTIHLDQSLPAVFALDTPPVRMLYDSPGRGKSRTILEGLVQYYGLYFVCAVEASIGSNDLANALTILRQSKRFAETSKTPGGVYDVNLLQSNEEVTSHRLHEVLLARIRILRAFLNVVEDSKNRLEDRDAKRIWTLLQVAPAEFMKSDRFVVLAGIYRNASASYLSEQIRTHTDWILQHLPSQPNTHGKQSRLFFVLDEAQRAAMLYPDSFASSAPEPRQARPVLSPDHTRFGRRRKSHFHNHHIRLEAAVANNGLFVRYRFTASFIEVLLVDGLKRPHRALGQYVKYMTKFEPNDRRYEDEQPLPNAPPDLVHKSYAHVFDGGFAHIDENLPMLALSTRLDRTHSISIANDFATTLRNQYSRPFAFETTVALYLATVMNNQTPLDRIFDFVDQKPQMASHCAVLVAADADVRELGHSYETFKYPTGERISNMLAKNHNNTQNIIDGAVPVAGITPNFNGNEVDNKKLVHHMRKLAHCEAEGDEERFRVLRVIASFPAKAVINRDISNAPVLPNGEKQHPLAVLNIEALLKNDPSKFLTATVKADLLCRVREASEEGEEKDDAEDEEEEEEEEEEDSQDEYRPTPAGKKQLESLELRKSQRPRR
ncbi:hypothetical protein EUX98_g4288 [Antrodiella citrinella]|uniref:Uncharacterized protein n=1 Tax=Antrodiella citrinella TaxID=2447956 RepID=A0A4S4MUC4_9APHY|nr:hypothetical protein EUX98_g4288 [Antrodiella citrinella]